MYLLWKAVGLLQKVSLAFKKYHNSYDMENCLWGEAGGQLECSDIRRELMWDLDHGASILIDVANLGCALRWSQGFVKDGERKQ